MTCEVCSPKPKGYTIYFDQEPNMKSLISYFEFFPKATWQYIHQQAFWAVESIFFDFMDYAESHLDPKSVSAVLSDQRDPLKNLNSLKPLYHFAKEREASWIDDLIATNAIATHYQPIVRMEEGEATIIGHELLSRGMNPDGTVISPFQMFEAAKIRNKVFSLDRACRLQSIRNAKVIANQLIFINFIPTAIYVPEHCLSSTFALIKELKIKPENVVFEVVETDEVKDLAHLQTILEYYRSYGFKYALDDVGTGFNHVEKLRKMKPDVVKLAIEFTNGVSKDPNKQKMAAEILTISHSMGALALAEGVEEKEDLHFLQNLGYDLFQGYYLAKPQKTPIKELFILEK